MSPRTFESAAREARADAQRHAAKGDLAWAAMRNRDADALERRAVKS